MASKEVKIPTIDFIKAELNPGNAQWESTKAQVFQALQEYGCFEAIYDNVPSEIREAMFGTLKEIFEFPQETKLKNLSDKPLQGYLGQIPQLPLYESMSISDLLQSQSIESFANIFWPDGNPNFCNVVKSYSKSHVELDEMVKRMVLESLGLQNYYVNDEFFDPNYYYLRFSDYKATKGENGDKIGLSGHTDVTILSIISQNQVNGLQVLKKNGDQWIDVNIAPNSFLVLSGDPFMAWTNGRVHSPVHRVTMSGDSDRFSIQLSSLPKVDYTIQAPKELVDEEHPLLFKPYESVGYFKYVMSEAGNKAGTGVFKAYCGV
ncbi:hypothetical protein K7X08_015290 [Anisodus acutangulus]|uniref:2-oxoglutarate-dependent dioxygenase DAO n=1 Tax=Anisodus acutangulus TaxID=402998 RepID=A0A9Q1L5J3_9SOLA|nr:hypothetical protein K7X08_015290 [Anisodus acutangulus]